MRNALYFILAIASFLPGQAIANDVAVTSLTVDKTNVQTSEELTLSLRVRNHGAQTIDGVGVALRTNYPATTPMHILSIAAPAGWQCQTRGVGCSTASLAGGAEVQLTYRLVAPATLRPEAFVVFGTAFLGGTDSAPENNELQQTIQLEASNRSADLSISVSAPPDPLPLSSPVTVAYDVRNNGPQDLSDVRVAFSIPANAPVFEGAGWTCAPVDESNTTCQRAFLAANANAPLTVRFTTPGIGGTFGTQAWVFALQPHLDADGSNGRAIRLLSIGSASEWTGLLVPFAAAETRGTNGSLWITELSAVIEADHHPRFGPTSCGPVEDPCSYPPLNRLFDPSEDFLEGDGPQFIYVGSVDAARFRLATRVYDATKSETTAGAFVPTARDEDFSPEGFSLIAIPVAPEFRSTLRVFDADGIDGREVELALYGDAEQEPFLRSTVRLTTVDEQQKVTNALLPRYPATAQIDLSALVPAQYTRVRVAVLPTVAGNPPSRTGMKLWGFASITNNETSHVSVVTP